MPESARLTTRTLRTRARSAAYRANIIEPEILGSERLGRWAVTIGAMEASILTLNGLSRPATPEGFHGSCGRCSSLDRLARLIIPEATRISSPGIKPLPCWSRHMGQKPAPRLYQIRGSTPRSHV